MTEVREQLVLVSICIRWHGSLAQPPPEQRRCQRWLRSAQTTYPRLLTWSTPLCVCVCVCVCVWVCVCWHQYVIIKRSAAGVCHETSGLYVIVGAIYAVNYRYSSPTFFLPQRDSAFCHKTGFKGSVQTNHKLFLFLTHHWVYPNMSSYISNWIVCQWLPEQHMWLIGSFQYQTYRTFFFLLLKVHSAFLMSKF